MVMIAMPVTLTKICANSEPELIISSKWPTNDRNTPTQNTASDCWPQTMSGIEHLPFQAGQSFGTKRMTSDHDHHEMQEAIRRQIGLVVRIEGGIEPVREHGAEIRKRPAMVMISAKTR